MTRREKLIVAVASFAIVGAGVAIYLELRPPASSKGTASSPTAGQRIETLSIREANGLSFELYLPEGFDPSVRHPLVFGGSPSGSGAELLQVWKPACDRLQWILVATNNFRNGPSSATDAALELETIVRVKRDYAIDEAHVYATGLSGAGMHAHDLIAEHPEIFRGIVVNTGMMPHHMVGNDPLDTSRYPRGKMAVFLASPTDFRYAEMKQDRATLEGLGWQVEWLEFHGGHRYAPPSLYYEAATWLSAH